LASEPEHAPSASHSKNRDRLGPDGSKPIASIIRLGIEGVIVPVVDIRMMGVNMADRASEALSSASPRPFAQPACRLNCNGRSSVQAAAAPDNKIRLAGELALIDPANCPISAQRACSAAALALPATPALLLAYPVIGNGP